MRVGKVAELLPGLKSDELLSWHPLGRGVSPNQINLPYLQETFKAYLISFPLHGTLSSQLSTSALDKILYEGEQ